MDKYLPTGRKGLLLLLALIYILMLGSIALPAAANAETNINLVLNGTRVQPSTPACIDNNGRTMVPIRFIMENMGSKVDWLADEQGIVIQRDATTIKMWIGKRQAHVNGQAITLDTTPVLKNNTTMVPVRFVTQAFGGQVNWDSNTQTVNISLGVTSVSGQVRLTGNYVNIRTGPGVAYNIITTLPRGTILKLLAENGGWYQVQLADGRQGWVSADYAERVDNNSPPDNGEQPGGVQQPGEPEPPVDNGPPAAGEIPPGQPLGLAVTGTKAVAVLAEPTPVEKQVGTAAAGSRLPIWQTKDDWWQVEYAVGKRGWVPAALVTYAPYESPPGADEGSAAGLEIIGVTVTPAGDTIEVTIKASDDFNFKTSRWENRLIVDVKGAVLALADGKDTIPVNRNPLARVRLGQYEADTVRIVFDLSGAARLTAKKAGDDEGMVFILEKPKLSGSIIVIDPGHGTNPESSDPGANGPTGVQEKVVNLAMAQKLAALLRNAGVNVYMTRDGESTPYLLAERAYYANNLGADLFISIHSNASLSSSASGSSTYFYAPPGTELEQQRGERQRLATAVQSALIAAIGRKNLGVMEANFSVLRNTSMPSVLVETVFISNSIEEKLLIDPAFQAKVAEGIFNGISTYFAGF